jgi:hypothetical protein
MKKSLCMFATTALLSAITLGTPASAVEIGRVLFANGDVRILATDGGSRAAKRGEAVQTGERMVTGNGALGQVRMRDGARVGVRGDSKVFFEPANTVGSKVQQLVLESGNVRVLNIAQQGKPALKPVEIKTPGGNLLMQGADVVVAKLEGSGAAGSVERVVVRVDEGTGQMSVKGGADAQKLALVSGQQLSVGGGKVEKFAGRLGGRARPASTKAQLIPSDSANEQRLGGRIPAGAKDASARPGRFASPPLTVQGKPSGGRPGRFDTTSRPQINLTARLPVFVPRAPLPPIARVPRAQLQCALGNCGTLGVKLGTGKLVNASTIATATRTIDSILAPAVKIPVAPTSTIKLPAITTRTSTTSKTGITTLTTIGKTGITTVAPTTTRTSKFIRR